MQGVVGGLPHQFALAGPGLPGFQQVDPVGRVGVGEGTPGRVDRGGDVADVVVLAVGQLGGAVVEYPSGVGGLAGGPDDNGSVGRGLAGVVVPDAPFQRRPGALQDPYRGLQVGAVQPVVDPGLGVIAVGVGAALLVPVIGIAEIQEVVGGRHTQGHGLRRVRHCDTQGRGLIEFDAFPVAVGVENLHGAGGAAFGVGEPGDAVGRGQRGDEIGSGGVVGEPGNQAEHVGDRDQLVRRAVAECRGAAERVGDFCDLEGVCRVAVLQGGLLPDRVGDRRDPQVGVVGQGDGVAGRIDQLGEEDPAGGDAAVGLAEHPQCPVRGEHLVRAGRGAGQQRLIQDLGGERLRGGVEAGEGPVAAAWHVVGDVGRRGGRVIHDVGEPVEGPLGAEIGIAER